MSNKVFVLVRPSYTDAEVRGVFMTRELAEKAAAPLDDIVEALSFDSYSETSGAALEIGDRVRITNGDGHRYNYYEGCHGVFVGRSPNATDMLMVEIPEDGRVLFKESSVVSIGKSARQ